jgi:hypothetical protein
MEIQKNIVKSPEAEGTGSMDVITPCVGPFDNPLNPKYVYVNGVKMPVDTLGAHRPWPLKRKG